VFLQVKADAVAEHGVAVVHDRLSAQRIFERAGADEAGAKRQRMDVRREGEANDVQLKSCPRRAKLDLLDARIRSTH
jgi:hypothetical protein